MPSLLFSPPFSHPPLVTFQLGIVPSSSNSMMATTTRWTVASMLGFKGFGALDQESSPMAGAGWCTSIWSFKQIHYNVYTGCNMLEYLVFTTSLNTVRKAQGSQASLPGLSIVSFAYQPTGCLRDLSHSRLLTSKAHMAYHTSLYWDRSVSTHTDVWSSKHMSHDWRGQRLKVPDESMNVSTLNILVLPQRRLDAQLSSYQQLLHLQVDEGADANYSRCTVGDDLQSKYQTMSIEQQVNNKHQMKNSSFGKAQAFSQQAEIARRPFIMHYAMLCCKIATSQDDKYKLQGITQPYEAKLPYYSEVQGSKGIHNIQEVDCCNDKPEDEITACELSCHKWPLPFHGAGQTTYAIATIKKPGLGQAPTSQSPVSQSGCQDPRYKGLAIMTKTWGIGLLQCSWFGKWYT
ncbi:hypothetical protein ARMGADRAFT_1028528 [Armillaria gallica]|uniref:Uncharacterized protein n=1 Tax=Armillaria gallica TaxID=47427 RepID=A0A2H3E622_ARMGA|nr:hypothetical protein ARMGADRAFT_1028528 [Armillaria gallica]